MTFKEFMKEINGERVEGELVKTISYSLLTSLVVLAIMYYLFLKNVSGFQIKYGFFIFVAIIAYSFIIPTVRQVRAYKQFNCMSGMMIGMTIGMISGFLPGFFVGATNGLFIGGVFGMLVGIVLGTWVGSCCGIMGFMEGIMAGFMGGLMGAMTSVMLLNDHLKIMTIIVSLLSIAILLSLNIMIYSETKESERQLREDHFLTIVISAILTTSTILLIIFGPRSSLFA